jgi:hypothetical protein
MSAFVFSGFSSTLEIASEWRTLKTYRDFSDLICPIFRAHFLPNGIHNPGELIRRQLAFLPTWWDMPCRINLSRIFRANSGANGSLPSLPWA